MSDEVVYRRVQRGKSWRYEPVNAPSPDVQWVEFTQRQCLTLAAAATATLLEVIYGQMPEHKLIARKIRRLCDAAADLTAGTGEQIDPDIVEWFVARWNEVVKQGGKQ